MMKVAIPLAITIAAFSGLAGCSLDQQVLKTDAEKAVVSSKPANQYYFYTEAQLAAQQGDSDSSIYYLKKAIELDSNSIFLKRELALVYARQKDYEPALALIDEVLLLQPKDIDTLILLGKIRQTQKKYAEARQAYESVLTHTIKLRGKPDAMHILERKGDSEKHAVNIHTACSFHLNMCSRSP